MPQIVLEYLYLFIVDFLSQTVHKMTLPILYHCFPLINSRLDRSTCLRNSYTVHGPLSRNCFIRLEVLNFPCTIHCSGIFSSIYLASRPRRGDCPWTWKGVAAPTWFFWGWSSSNVATTSRCPPPWSGAGVWQRGNDLGRLEAVCPQIHRSERREETGRALHSRAGCLLKKQKREQNFRAVRISTHAWPFVLAPTRVKIRKSPHVPCAEQVENLPIGLGAPGWAA